MKDLHNNLSNTIRSLTAYRGFPEAEGVALLAEVESLPEADQRDLLEHFRNELSAYRFAGPAKQVFQPAAARGIFKESFK